MKMFKGYCFALLAVVTVSSNLHSMNLSRPGFLSPSSLLVSSPKPIQDYFRMLGQIIKEQQKIGKLVSRGDYVLAREVSGVGFKVGQANYWLRQNIKENLKSLRALHPKIANQLSRFFDLLDSFYDAEADILGSARFIDASDLDKFNTVLKRLGWDNTDVELKAIMKVAPISILPKALISRLLDARIEALYTGKMIYNRFNALLRAKEKKQKKLRSK